MALPLAPSAAASSEGEHAERPEGGGSDECSGVEEQHGLLREEGLRGVLEKGLRDGEAGEIGLHGVPLVQVPCRPRAPVEKGRGFRVETPDVSRTDRRIDGRRREIDDDRQQQRGHQTSRIAQKTAISGLAYALHLGALMHKTTAFAFSPIAAWFLVALGALSGCGDAGMLSRAGSSSDAVSGFGSDLDPANVAIRYDSSRCDESDTGCPKTLVPNVEVFVDGKSILIDFSNVDGPGVFDEGTFEGFVIEVVRSADSPIFHASIDREATTLDVDEARLAYDETGLEINLAGASYDSNGFIKVDLLVGPLNILRNGR